MFRILLPAIMIVLGAVNAGAQTSATVSLQQNGWIIKYSQESATLSIAADRLGSIVRELQFNEETPLGLRRLDHLSVSISANGQLIVKTTEPPSEWEFDAQPGELTIVTTGYHGVLTGWADSPQGRRVSRLLDPEGLPVNWQGTDEVTGTYGGKHAINRSYLPRYNPEVTYLGLGHVSGEGLHSLFDRETDIAVDFGEGSDLQAVVGNKDAFALSLPVRGWARIKLIPDYYTHILGLPFYIRFDDSHFRTAPITWSSWTSYYGAVSEQDVVRNADWLAENLKPYGFEYVQLDAGYDVRPGGHSWVKNWDADKFPHGPEWLVSTIHGKGLKAGLWVVPNTSTLQLKEHPDWYLYDKQGKVLLDYQTPALDSTNPAVLKFLAWEFTKLDDLGFDYYKFDGELPLPAYAPPVDKSRLYSPSADFIENYRDRLALIRRTIGPDRFIELCPTGVPLDAVGYADSYFNGEDVYNNWHGMYAYFSSINANLFLNHIVSYVMPGEGMDVSARMSAEEAKLKRPAIALKTESTREDPSTGFGVTLPEARTLVTYAALTGVVYSLASVMPELPPDRVALLQATMPTLPIMPIDLFSRGTESSWDKFKHVQTDYYIHHYPEVLDLKVDEPAGVYDVAAETNWRSKSTVRRLEFAHELGLSADGSYIVFDFWNQKPLGVFKGKVDLTIEPHDTRVLLIHPQAGRPQLIGNSRHISGSYSILSQGWDEAKKELHGESLTIAGKGYTLWFAIPGSYEKASAQVSGKDGKAIPCEWKQQGQFASLRFMGTGEPAEWRVRF